MIITILGCGTSTGVPLIHCKCSVCRSGNPKNKRLRASAWIQLNGKNLLIDTSTDLRQQALRSKMPRIDAVLYTHPHADHIHGIDELRSYNFIQKQTIPLFGNAWTCKELTQRFPYIFNPGKHMEGGGIPLLSLHRINAKANSFSACGIKIIPVSTFHGSMECIAYRIGSFAYVTDCSAIPESSIKRLQDLSVMVLDCLRLTPHPTHLNLKQALEIVAKVKAKKTILTHMGHEFDFQKWRKKLPKGVSLAYDGQTIKNLSLK